MGSSLLGVLGAAATAAIIAFVVSRIRSRTRSRRIRELIHLSDSLLGPALYRETPVQEGDMLNALERSLWAIAAEVRNAVDRLEVEVARRETILASMGEGVLAVDHDLRIIFCNQALTRAIGFGGAVRDRLPLLELIRDSEILEILGEVVRSGTCSKRLLKPVAAHGSSYEMYAAPLDGRTGRGAIAIFHDITGLERLEQVRKDFIANVSHEMRTPLASIIAYSDTLLEGALEDAAVNRKFIEVIRSNAVRLNNISADLLTLSDLESGVVPGEPERVAVREVLESAVRAVETEARAACITIVRGTIDDAAVMGYRLRLEQALVNLLVNGVKFNRPHGEVRVAVAHADGSVSIQVSDTGIGIPSQDVPRIFERFYRVDKARSRQAGGTGLGLSIVKHVVEGMKGSIRVESQLGRGSTFTINLPHAPSE